VTYFALAADFLAVFFTSEQQLQALRFQGGNQHQQEYDRSVRKR